MFWIARPAEMFSHPGYAERWNGRYAGTEAGLTINSHGYRLIKIFNRQYLAHRVAWAIYHGAWPQLVDHRDHNRSNNRIKNLRSVSKLVNQRNQKMHRTNTSGHTGVAFNIQNGKWFAYIKDRGQQVHLGSFNEIVPAIAARKAAEKRLGYHSSNGK
jgi:hypothetical protein